MVKRKRELNRGLHLVKVGLQGHSRCVHAPSIGDGACDRQQSSPASPPMPLKARLRWYLSLRYWRQACAICCVNAATFAVWEIAVR
jgi:hypothetical protein